MGQRPSHVKPPAYLSENPPLPEPGPAAAQGSEAQPAGEDPDRLDPTRYGDWERKGVAVDF